MKKIAAFILASALLCLSGFAADSTAAGAPVAENLELSTYRAVAVGGRLSASDSDGQVVAYEITTPPGKGSVELGEDGCFVYTPDEGKKGRDYFGYKALDDQGNYSHEATVIIRILKQKTRTTYSDMEGHPSAWAAVMLAEEGIFTGECLAGEYVFDPDRAVGRDEFLALCMKAADISLLRDPASTGFADDEAIPAWAKAYVGTAASLGLVHGCDRGSSGIRFEPDRAVSALEAALMLDRVMGLTDAVAVWHSFDESVPAWARQSLANLSVRSILPGELELSAESISRAQAAEMICRAMLEKEG